MRIMTLLPRCSAGDCQRPLLAVLLLLLGTTAQARGVYQEPQQFLAGAFEGRVPAAQVLWLTGDLRREAARILGHGLGALRVRYWVHAGRSAWILDEIGKEQPITVGVVVQRGALEQIKVLVFRESRGDEVRHPAFTGQFAGARLTGAQQLDRTIDGITGATLSVRAVSRLARLALYLHGFVESGDDPD